MSRFLSGFVIASVVWIGLIYADAKGHITLFTFLQDEPEDEEIAEADTSNEEVVENEGKKGKKKRRGRRRARRRTSSSPMKENVYDTREGVAGDALGGPAARELVMGAVGGEEQLSTQEVNQGIDRVFRGIERCLALAPADAPMTGKVTFGLRIAPNGQVTKVSLNGPNVMIKGEVGACFRRTVKSIRYRSFDGPDMTVHLPVTFD